jgi:hypothetical protein
LWLAGRLAPREGHVPVGTKRSGARVT